MSDPNIKLQYLGGCCPVQAEGTIDDEPFYFRARGEHWSMSIGGDDVVMDPEWYHEEPYGDEAYAAGYMPQWEALGFIAKAVGMYAARSDEHPAEEVSRQSMERAHGVIGA